jgi:hypothetical protein
MQRTWAGASTVVSRTLGQIFINSFHYSNLFFVEIKAKSFVSRCKVQQYVHIYIDGHVC